MKINNRMEKKLKTRAKTLIYENESLRTIFKVECRASLPRTHVIIKFWRETSQNAQNYKLSKAYRAQTKRCVCKHRVEERKHILRKTAAIFMNQCLHDMSAVSPISDTGDPIQLFGLNTGSPSYGIMPSPCGLNSPGAFLMMSLATDIWECKLNLNQINWN